MQIRQLTRHVSGLTIRETLGDRIAGALGAPPVFAREQANRGEAGFAAQVEPMGHLRRYTDEIARLANHVVNVAVAVDVEAAASLGEETHLVVGMRVLEDELRAHRLDVDDRLLDAYDVDETIAGL